jgi:beta-aspartyl-peptidase (threonine type)
MIHFFDSRLPILAIHGGAGDLRPEDLSPDQAAAYESALRNVLAPIWRQLKSGSSALDTVVEAVRMLEDEPLFNAGRGSVFTAEGYHEMDACVMCGQSHQAGALAGVRNLRNPILTARAILHEKNFVLLGGSGAEQYAREQGHVFEEDAYFYSQARYEQLCKAKEARVVALDHHKYGTVGAVAVDSSGHCAAATSTGGLTNKQYGRIGDSPLVGAGTLAEDGLCAVSCTGYGEPFILRSAAHQVASRIRFGMVDLKEAVRATVDDDLLPHDGDGGLIAVAPNGQIVLGYNSAMMYRGWVGGSVEMGVGIA